jgi:lysine/arginine/ornithine transport system substrate-binding protein
MIRMLNPARLFILAIMALCAGLATGSGSAAETLRIGTEGAYPPFEYRDPSGAIKGFDIDIGNALCAAMQTECKWVAQDFDGLIPALKSGKIDMIMSSMSITDERRKAIDFSKPYYHSLSQLIALRSAGISDDPALLRTRTIAVQSGTIHQAYLDQKMPDVQTKSYNTMQEAELDLEAGRVDAILADKLLMYDWLMKGGAAKGFDFAGKPIDDPILAGNIAVGIVKGNVALKARLDAAIDQILSDGTYDHISERYFPFNIRPE